MIDYYERSHACCKSIYKGFQGICFVGAKLILLYQVKGKT